jgi:hypothetical protein
VSWAGVRHFAAMDAAWNRFITRPRPAGADRDGCCPPAGAMRLAWDVSVATVKRQVCLSAWCHESGLVGEYDGLDAVTYAELGEEPVDV